MSDLKSKRSYEDQLEDMVLDPYTLKVRNMRAGENALTRLEKIEKYEQEKRQKEIEFNSTLQGKIILFILMLPNILPVLGLIIFLVLRYTEDYWQYSANSDVIELIYALSGLPFALRMIKLWLFK